jgi:hypothetical protein
MLTASILNQLGVKANITRWRISIAGLLLSLACAADKDGGCVGDCPCGGDYCICPSSGDCDIRCGYDCDLTCAGSGNCDFLCDVACDVSCTSSGECFVDVAANSHVACTGSGDCNVNCRGDCTVECSGSGVCTMFCAEGADCMIQRCNDYVNACDDRRFVCGAPC